MLQVTYNLSFFTQCLHSRSGGAALSASYGSTEAEHGAVHAAVHTRPRGSSGLARVRGRAALCDRLRGARASRALLGERAERGVSCRSPMSPSFPRGVRVHTHHSLTVRCVGYAWVREASGRGWGTWGTTRA